MSPGQGFTALGGPGRRMPGVNPLGVAEPPEPLGQRMLSLILEPSGAFSPASTD